MRTNGSKALSRGLRRGQTDAEKRLWAKLRNSQMNGVKFRRQLPIGPYAVDFCSLEKMVVIELDGGQHAERIEKDEVRTKFLEKEGFKVLRFWNNEILGDLEAVLVAIGQRLGTAPSPRPSPLKGEGGMKKERLGGRS